MVRYFNEKNEKKKQLITFTMSFSEKEENKIKVKKKSPCPPGVEHRVLASGAQHSNHVTILVYGFAQG